MEDEMTVLENRARQILRQYTDQDFSYVDAVSFALMQEVEITEAFAFDRHFTTAGFVCVP
jgi:predicted nucleic acid-binding protein